MARETLQTRVTRLEESVQALIDEQIKTEQRFRELREEANERERRADERIEKLVSAIGEWIRRNSGPPPP
jgi:hypothetical protein